ncbi:hypothetical protein PROFUN_01687 [Planoprotostelium fungivorum]|uniref:Homeobox domain-containing protein n=1 Tax=Planoprotostelium fungivorum TaxID=1890364 RepID=A0A2P6MW81_9EUKA|nr:hypothetical protein PROFUN_01687 [Planoprotostelium fungivorum]
MGIPQVWEIEIRTSSNRNLHQKLTPWYRILLLRIILSRRTRVNTRSAPIRVPKRRVMNVSSIMNPRDSVEEEGIDRLRMSLYRLTPPENQRPTEYSRPRRVFSIREREELLQVFKRSPYPEEEERCKLAKRYHVDHMQITVWFQNQRSRWCTETICVRSELKAEQFFLMHKPLQST